MVSRVISGSRYFRAVATMTRSNGSPWGSGSLVASKAMAASRGTSVMRDAISPKTVPAGWETLIRPLSRRTANSYREKSEIAISSGSQDSKVLLDSFPNLAGSPKTKGTACVSSNTFKFRTSSFSLVRWDGSNHTTSTETRPSCNPRGRNQLFCEPIESDPLPWS